MKRELIHMLLMFLVVMIVFSTLQYRSAYAAVDTTKNGWQQIDGEWYYAEDGEFVCRGLRKIGKYTYGFDYQGKMISDDIGWILYDPQDRLLEGLYFDALGHMVMNKWVHHGGAWYYAGADGQFLSGLQKIGKYYYYFPRWNDYQMCTGLEFVYNDHYSYFDENGRMRTGWIRIDSDEGTDWYYADSDGVIQTGWKKVGNATYFFKSSGVMAAGEWCEGYWLNSNGKWTYKHKASWRKNSKGWWFGDPSGWFAQDETIVIDDKEYTFDSEGYWVR